MGVAWPGKAWPGLARRGSARLGKAPEKGFPGPSICGDRGMMGYMDAVSSRQAVDHGDTGAFHSPKGEGRKPARPSTRTRSRTSNHRDPPPSAPKPEKKGKRERGAHLVASIDLEVTAPVAPATWPELNLVLWEAASAVPEAQRAVIAHLISRDVTGGSDTAASTEAYRVACEALERRRLRCAEDLPKAKEDAQRAKLVLGARLRLNTGTVVCVASKAAADAHAKWRKEQWKKGPPWYKRPGIPLHNRGVVLSQDKAGVHCALTLFGKDAAGHNQRPVVVGVAACGGSAWATLRKLLTREWEPRAARLVRDDERRAWVLKLSYEYPMPEKATGERVLVVRRGMTKFLSMLVDDGTMPAPLDSAESLIAFKRGIEARKGALRRHLPHQGRGARGHGKKRWYRSYERLGELEANYVTTWCRQQAAHVAKTAVKYGCGRVLIEEFEKSQPPTHPDPFVQKLLRRFPFCQLRDAIKQALVKVGVELEAVPSDHNAQRCPKCGSDDPAQHDRRARWFRCKGCEVGGGSDFIAMWNTLRDAGVRDDAVELLAKKAAAMVQAAQRRQKVEHSDEA